MYMLLLLNFIVPLVMLLVGTLLKKHPAAAMSGGSGYNTPTARRSQAHWDYAQRIAPDIFIRTGKQSLLRELVLCILFLLLRTSISIAIALGTAVGFAFLIYGFVQTEKAIKERFPA